MGLNSDVARGKTGVTYKHSKKNHNEFNSKRSAGPPSEGKQNLDLLASVTKEQDSKMWPETEETAEEQTIFPFLKIHSAIHPSPSHHIASQVAGSQV